MDKITIKEWLQKCKEKARDSVKKDIEDYLISFSLDFPQWQKDYDEFKSTWDKLRLYKEKYPKLNLNVHIKCFSYHPAFKDVKFEGLAGFILASMVYENWQTHLDEVARLLKKRADVNKEYDSLIHNVMQMSDTKSIIEYLTDLGFDTTSLLVMPDNVNKNLLFVCNNNKP